MTEQEENLGDTFPIADKLNARVLTSVKSLDTAASSYQDSSKLLSKVKSYTNQLNNFTSRSWNGVEVRSTDYDSKVLEFVIPDIQLSATQLQAIINAKAYAQSLGITLKVIVAK